MAKGVILGQTQIPQSVEDLTRFNNGLGNEYLWSKNEYVWKYDILKTGGVGSKVKVASPGNIYYSDSFIVNSSGKFDLDNKTLKNDTASIIYTSLRGKFVGQPNATNMTELFYIPPSAAVYYQNGIFASELWAYKNTRKELNVVSYVNSPLPNAYPPSVSDGHEYKPLGQLGQFSKIETGSYVGTGTYGINNPSTLTFGFAPKIVFISLKEFSGSPIPAYIGIFFYDSKIGMSTHQINNSEHNYYIVSWDKNSMTWYPKYEQYGESGQLNSKFGTYNYIAFG